MIFPISEAYLIVSVFLLVATQVVSTPAFLYSLFCCIHGVLMQLIKIRFIINLNLNGSTLLNTMSNRPRLI